MSAILGIGKIMLQTPNKKGSAETVWKEGTN